MIDLQNGSFIISPKSIESTWPLVREAIEHSSTKEYWWTISEEPALNRMTAYMEYAHPGRFKRNLFLEINFFPASDERVRIELHYNVMPAINVKRPKELFTLVTESIADCLSGEAVDSEGKSSRAGSATVYSGASRDLPQELAQISKPDEGHKSIMRGIEILLIFNVFIVVFSATNKAAEAVAPSFIAAEFFLGMFAGIIMAVKQLFDMGSGKGHKSGSKKSVLQVVLLFCVGGLLTILALPFILFGLCFAIVCAVTPHR